jgi:SPASM domain peptide maturase of grasp-with-spasm system
MNKDFFRLFANCIPVKGARRSIICDLQRHTYSFIPNDLFEILQECKGSTYYELRNRFKGGDLVVFDEYFEFLVSHEYGFWCDNTELELFPDLKLVYEAPSIITNAIIDVSERSIHNYNIIFKQLDDLGCKHLQIRFFKFISLAELEEVLKMLYDKRIRSVQLLLQYSSEYTKESLTRLCWRNLRIINIVVASSPEQSSHLAGVDDYTNINFLTQNIDNCHSCGLVNEAYLTVDIHLFSESQAHNSCLNRKIGIDEIGDIKNCPSMVKSFGNVSLVELKSVISDTEFTKLWSINKDQIKGCMDCEFRYICTDCRAYLSDATDLQSKPLKCGYNPHTAIWSESNY